MPSIYLPQSRIDLFIQEDVPYLDLTSFALGLNGQPGRIEYFTRQECVLAGGFAVERMAASLGCAVLLHLADGTRLSAGQTFFVAEGPASALHQLWKVGLNTFDHLCAIATKTRAMVNAAHEKNPRCEVLTTRKSMPGVKDLLTHAILVGGAFPHRLGLSETVLVFDQHISFLGGLDSFLERLPQMKARCCEKKLFVEATPGDACRIARAGVDGIQLDKATPDALRTLVPELRAIDAHLTIIAAGGIGPDNAAAYAATGVDGIATTAPFTAKPIDMSARIVPA